MVSIRRSSSATRLFVGIDRRGAAGDEAKLLRLKAGIAQGHEHDLTARDLHVGLDLAEEGHRLAEAHRPLQQFHGIGLRDGLQADHRALEGFGEEHPDGDRAVRISIG